MSTILSCHLPLRLRNSFINTSKFTKLLVNNARKNMFRFMSHKAQTIANEKFIPFLEMINMRRSEARRSIVVQVQSAHSYKELHSYCSSFGTVEQMQHYTIGVEPMNFILVEFASETDVTNILANSSHVEDTAVMPVHSQFLWFKATNRKLPKLKQSKDAILTLENCNQAIKPVELNEILAKANSVSEQMTALYNSTKLDETGTRLRFLTARQVENAVKGMFPNASALPFGSSVNGYGQIGCDLDLVLRLYDDKINDEARLIFHCKAVTGSERTNSQRNMETIGDMLQLFLPGCAQVRRILQARVPIIKYYQQLTDVECDLSMSNLSGVHMSDFLYIMGAMDPRIKPLIFTIRKWAREIGLTNHSPGRWITNFSLTLLVLAFLQKPINSPPILPSLNSLVKLAGPKDNYMTEDGINCTFLRDINKIKFASNNLENLENLLIEFFEFYSQFDFSSKAICLNEAVMLTKPEHCAMYIVNPLERGLNVSKNVSAEELERFKLEARNAIWLMESQEKKIGNWGLLALFDNKRKPNNFSLSTKQGRLMEISTLFEASTEAGAIEYKSETVKQQIKNIKTETKNKLKELQKLNR